MKNLYILLAVLLAVNVSAQQDPQYTQYMYNMNIVNPAYAGSYEGVAIGALVSETNTYVDFSYTLPVGTGTKLAFGLKAGFTFHDIGTGSIATIDEGDPFFAQDINETTPNIGAGLYFYKPNKYYISKTTCLSKNSIRLTNKL